MQKKIERKKKPFHYRHANLRRKSKSNSHAAFYRPEIVPALKSTLSRIGKPYPAPFVPDEFQVKALEAIKKTDCLVIAPTGSGKTWIAREAILSVLEKGGRAWYASPLKALSNSKWIEFGLHFDTENVGIITGDTKENTEAPIIVGTTEILRNQLYDAMHQGKDLNCDLVILDEAHFLGDTDRGVVWEEIMIYLPARIHLLLLSATIGNGEEIAHWLESIRKKSCAVVAEDKRPVPLYPLFLHPSGCLHPFLEGKKVSPPVADFIRRTDEKRLRGGKMPDYIGIIRVLEKFNLLPAIFFLKSRAECDAALTARGMLQPLQNATVFSYSLDELLGRFPTLARHRQLKVLRSMGLASHHGGQLPAWKMLVEEMMNRGHLRVIFATSTIAAGVNFPARTIVLFNSDLFNGSDFSPLTATEFRQMTGRAGRRGQDNIGFMLTVTGKFMNLNHIRGLLFQKPEDILSRLKNDFAMVLNLLLSQTPDDVRKIFERSLAAYQQNSRHESADFSAAQSLWKDFSRHLKFLKQEGFVDESGALTDDGCWASKLRLDYPLLVAQCLRENAFPQDNEKILAALVALLAYDRDNDMKMTVKDLPPKLALAFKKVMLAVRPLIHRMENAGFAPARLHTLAGVAMYLWAQGYGWDSVIKATGIAEGDMATLVLRTADNLRQIASLKDTYPDIAGCAQRARETILREPVLFL
ncbi:MAG TPA: DEAD/DEAH box helicase [Smithella sp.]|jgi:superfamily II RNA helicase|nr:DEAD/DEAH box helicase [Smithella sp.]OQC53375.1 MAG: ski2-like helicase [Deltaproteobacteria bacterium ADurb.Bin022]HNQ65808.1 DEAD/DEAH box helicase [Smithella sp.]HOO35856.1 DEAD/DEAH box helicase [Smithella sp.]HOX97824.1 DEAD/DEAH box helicase [Smithella sp.]